MPNLPEAAPDPRDLRPARKFDMAEKPAFERSPRLVAVAACAMDAMALLARSTSSPMPTRRSCAFTMSVANWFICKDVTCAACTGARPSPCA